LPQNHPKTLLFCSFLLQTWQISLGLAQKKHFSTLIRDGSRLVGNGLRSVQHFSRPLVGSFCPFEGGFGPVKEESELDEEPKPASPPKKIFSWTESGQALSEQEQS
jgi:hypothetical protein